MKAMSFETFSIPIKRLINFQCKPQLNQRALNLAHLNLINCDIYHLIFNLQNGLSINHFDQMRKQLRKQDGVGRKLGLLL